MHEAIKLPIGIVSGVGRGMGALDWSTSGKGKGRFWGFEWWFECIFKTKIY